MQNWSVREHVLEAPLATDLPRAPWEISGTGHAIEAHTTVYSLLTPQHVSTDGPYGYPLGTLIRPEETVSILNNGDQ